MVVPKYDVIVIGGGPAGLMAAGQAAQAGANTLLLEKMAQPGRKLRITGKGRCNLTNVASLEEFMAHFGETGKFLRQAFYAFFAQDLIAFIEGLGISTVTERGGRVFPASNEAGEIVDGLVQWAEELGATIQPRSPVDRLVIQRERVVGVDLATRRARPASSPKSGIGGGPYYGRAIIIATGGASYPGTGSTGDGYRLARSVGHTIVPVRPALVPLETAGDVALRLQGLSLRNVTARVLLDGKPDVEAFGEMLFTHFGLSGPTILTLSRRIVDALRDGRQVTVSIDLKPALDEDRLDARLLRDLNAHGKRQFGTLLKGLLPRKLIPVCTAVVRIPQNKEAHQITAEERAQLRTWMKDFRLDVIGHRSFEEAIVTAGGVETREVDPRTMASRLVDGLYFAGEVLDVDADTGGYNLQAAFSTGWVAGRAAAGAVGPRTR